VNGPNARRPALVYNPNLNQFLLVYENDVKRNNRFAIFAVRLSSLGRRSGRAVVASDSTDSALPIANLSSNLVFDFRANNYIIFWMRTALNASGTAKEGVNAAILNPDLTLNKARVRISNLLRSGDNIRGPYLIDLKIHPANGKIIAAGYLLQYVPTFNWQYFVTSINLTLQNPTIRLLNLKSGLSGGAAPGISLTLQNPGQSFAVFVEGTGLQQRKISPVGRPIAAVRQFFNSPLQTTKVEFPFSLFGKPQSFVVAVEVNLPAEKIWLQAFNSAGSAAGTPVEIDSSVDRAAAPVLSQLPTPTGGKPRYVLIYVDGRQNFPPMSTDSSALTLVKITP
jgi:hypothetical protein